MAEQLWGEETDKAVENFPVSGHPVLVSAIRVLGASKRLRRAPTPISESSTPRSPRRSRPPATRSQRASTTISSPSMSSKRAPAPRRT